MVKFANALTFVGFLALWTFSLYVMFDLRKNELSTRSASISTETCSEKEGCMEAHLNNSYLQKMLAHRCKLGYISTSYSPYRKISFTHIPKAGGSSVNEFLRRNAPGRLRSHQHEHFIAAKNSDPKSMLLTLFREPTSMAISFYSYVKDYKKFPLTERNNTLWKTTYHSEPVPWSRDPTVQHMLAQGSLPYFLRSVNNASEVSSRLDMVSIRQLPPVPPQDTVSGDLAHYLRYTTGLPEQYQCRQHLEVAFILLKHYEVVGTLEKSADFYKVLTRRAQLKRSYAGTAADPIHLNRSKYQHKVLNQEDRAAMEANLKDALYCATVLWKLAGKISDADMACSVPS